MNKQFGFGFDTIAIKSNMQNHCYAQRQCPLIANRIPTLMMIGVLILLLQLTGGNTQSIDSNNFVAPTDIANIDSIATKTKNTTFIERERQRRQLQLFGGVIDRRCERLFDNTIENIFSRTDCSCDPVGFPPALVVDCQRTQESCIVQRRFTNDPNDKLLCGSPGLRVIVNVWSIVFAGSPVTAEICFYDASVFNITLPDIFNPVCFGLFTGLPGSVPLANILELIFGITGSTAQLLKDAQASSSFFKRRRKPMAISDSSCVPNIGSNKEACNSCTICTPEKGGGMMFDCSNIVPDFRFASCTKFPTFH